MNSRTVLLIDAVGAAVTGVVIGVLLVSERILTGLPTQFLYSLAMAGMGLMGYDLFSYFRSRDPARSLQRIVGLNLSYCVVVLLSLIVYRDRLTWIGLVYFLFEIAIIVALSSWEWRISRSKSHGGYA